MTTHEIPLENAVLHGSFSREHAPVLTVEPGDRVVCSTLDGDWLTASLAGPPARHGPERPGRRADLDAGHAMIGPIAVRGAHPGSALRITIDELVPGSWGWSRSGGRETELFRALGVDAGPEHYLRWEVDAARGEAVSNEGHVVATHPFLGLIGCAPDQAGLLSTHPPRRTGGNIDCKELGVGSELHLPVEVDGALLSIGDGHAAQGDGESGSTAIECPMERVVLTVDLVPGIALGNPRAVSREGWITFGFDPSLDVAAHEALDEMVSLMCERLGTTRTEALNLAGAVVDLRITQIVNGVKGVHAVLPHRAARLLAR